jgi:diguanylate cyclase (GGDEF)-like protein
MRIMTMPSVDLDGSPAMAAGRSIHLTAPRAAAPGIVQADLTGFGSELDRPDLPRRVLLVEPVDGDCSRLGKELLASQMEVYTAHDLVTAARAISSFKPNVILSHMRSPTYDGLELVYRLKQDRSTRFTPVFLYSSVATVEERVMALDLGAVDLLSEPFAGAELIARVRAALRTRHVLSMLEQSAQLDDLTGLANRRVLGDHLRREWDACRRRGVPLAVIIVDLDHFKTINDTHGHAVGDEVLCRAAGLLAQSVRSSDFVARYGGEEFVVVAPDCELWGAAALAERFRSALATHASAGYGCEITLTASAGVAATDCADGSPAVLLGRADKALYEAKRSGRDAICVYDPAQKGPVAAAGAVAAEWSA